MHDDVAEFMSETVTLTVGRLVPVQKYARWHIQGAYGYPIHRQSGEVAVDHDATGTFDPTHQILHGPHRNEPISAQELRDPLRIAVKLVDVHNWQRKFRLKVRRLQQSPDMKQTNIEFGLKPLKATLADACPLSIHRMNAHR